MTNDPTARLDLPTVDPPTAARLRYAFAAYAALHGIRVVDAGPADVVVAWGDAGADTADVVVAAGYHPRPDHVPAPAPRWIDGLPCFHPAPSGRPDPLAEVFEWLAAPHERACTDLDDIGRVPPRHGLAGTHGLDLRVPWANRWLARLHAEVRAALPRLPEAPPSPFGPGRTLVASHDLDHLSADRVVNTRRVVRNAGIALLHDRDVRTTLQVGRAAAGRVARRRPTADAVRDVLAGEAARGVPSTYTAVPHSSHRRDPGYRLDDAYVRDMLAEIAAGGHEVAVHGSYRSLEVEGGLAAEYDAMRRAGHAVSGGRQHWLRHRGDELYAALVEGGASWDSTAGYPDDIGFRHGAAFPFAPYDLAAERAFPIIEIPLVIMDRALCRTGRDPRRWTDAAREVLHAGDADGWGGVAVLWHDSAFTGTTMPAPLADVYWALLDDGDRWETADEVARRARTRWEAAGVWRHEPEPTRRGGDPVPAARPAPASPGAPT